MGGARVARAVRTITGQQIFVVLLDIHSPILQIISRTQINLRCESFVFSPLLTSLSTYRDLISLPPSIGSFHQVISSIRIYVQQYFVIKLFVAREIHMLPTQFSRRIISDVAISFIVTVVADLACRFISDCIIWSRTFRTVSVHYK